jgi:P2-related tail formation protein
MGKIYQNSDTFKKRGTFWDIKSVMENIRTTSTFPTALSKDVKMYLQFFDRNLPVRQAGETNRAIYQPVFITIIVFGHIK